MCFKTALTQQIQIKMLFEGSWKQDAKYAFLKTLH